MLRAVVAPTATLFFTVTALTVLGALVTTGEAVLVIPGGPVIASLVITTVLASAYTPLIAQT